MTGPTSIGSQAAAQAARGVDGHMSVTLLKQTLDHAEVEGEAAVSMIESAAEVTQKQPSRGPTEPGLGRGVDVRA